MRQMHLMHFSLPLLLALLCLIHLGVISAVHAFQHGRIVLFKRCDAHMFNNFHALCFYTLPLMHFTSFMHFMWGVIVQHSNQLMLQT